MKVNVMHTKSKIQLPWAHEEDSEAQRLKESKTLAYWDLAQAWNGHSPSVTIGEAITASNMALNGIDPTKKLAVLISSIRDNIVIHGTKSKMIKFNKRTNKDLQPPQQARMILL